MKKYLPYLLGGIALIILIILVITTPFSTSKKLDERITLRQKDKIPYGTYAAYQLLPALFPKATVGIEKRSPLDWAYDTVHTTSQVMFITARIFNPEEDELLRLLRFIESGNYVFIIANTLSEDAAQFLATSGSGTLLNVNEEDSLQLQLNNPPFTASRRFKYPGKKWDSYFLERDEQRTKVIGTDAEGYPNFIQLQSGRGKLFVHLAPLAFSNYFILHQNNLEYFQKAVSLIPASISHIIWNEYYLSSRRKDENDPNILSVLWQYPAFRWALLTAIGTLLLYVLIEMKRRRYFIPASVKPVNDSLDYVRTLGRLYHDKKDHQNLARKMTAVFLDAVRSRYNVFTQNVNEEFIEQLYLKTGYNRDLLTELISFVQYIQADHTVTEQQLATYHQHLESFYQNT